MKKINKNELDAIYELNEGIRRKSNLLKYISFVLLSLMGTFFIMLSIGNENPREINPDPKNIQLSEIRNYIDSSIQEKIVISDIEIVKEIITKFCTTLNNDNSLNSTDFYADTLERYYLKQNISIKEVEKEILAYSKKYPESTIDFSADDLFIKEKNMQYIAYLPVKYSETPTSRIQRILYEIKLNRNFEIVYVRNYITDSNSNIIIDTNNMFRIINPHEEILLKEDTIK